MRPAPVLRRILRRAASLGVALELAACSGGVTTTVEALDTDASGTDANDTGANDTGATDTDATAADLAGTDASGDAPSLPAPHTETLGGDRPVDVTVPDQWTPQKTWPLILVLHGYGASGNVQSAFLGVSARASQYGYVTLAPDGTRDDKGNLFWNATPACCNFNNKPVDDVAYLSGLIDAAVDKLAVDPKRVYVVGHSNGGFMAYRLACEKSQKITAIAVIAGAANPDASVCGQVSPVSVLHIHGTKDDTIQYDGGVLSIAGFEGTAYPGAMASVLQWLERDGCGVYPTNFGQHDFDSVVSGAETTSMPYPACPPHIAVEMWQMEGSGHIPAFTDDFREALPQWLMARTRP